MGVLGVVPGQIGLIQATETIKLILDKGNPLIGRILVYDALDATFKEFGLKKNKECPLCGMSPVITDLIHVDYREPMRACTV